MFCSGHVKYFYLKKKFFAERKGELVKLLYSEKAAFSFSPVFLVI